MIREKYHIKGLKILSSGVKMSESISRDTVLGLIMKSAPEDYMYDDYDGLYVYNPDINLRISLEETEEFEGEFEEPWVSKFANKVGQKQLVRIYYLATPICKVYCVWVDGSRHLIPMPLGIGNLNINPFQYKIGSILNYHFPSRGFDQALHKAGIKIQDN